jgi:glycerophosphoryl diester phosphodiesterase
MITPSRPPVIVIAHRGASGYVPEHTLASYRLAIEMGAHFIEPDLVLTCDGELIARHDNTLDLTTDVAQHAEFAARKTTKSVDGKRVTGWFSEDFTLAEIKRLRAIERLPDLRPAGARLDGQFEVPTLREIIALARTQETVTGRRIGIYPEIKHPTYFRRLGFAMEQRLVQALHANGYEDQHDRVFIQSFEVDSLQRLRGLTPLPLVQLLDITGNPYDIEATGGALTYDQMATATGLAEIAEYAAAVGPEKNHFILPLDGSGRLHAARATDFVRNAHAAGLLVHPYTFRAENHFLPVEFRGGGGANAHGDLEGEMAAFLAAGVDGLFTDHADIGVRACARWNARRQPHP